MGTGCGLGVLRSMVRRKTLPLRSVELALPTVLTVYPCLCSHLSPCRRNKSLKDQSPWTGDCESQALFLAYRVGPFPTLELVAFQNACLWKPLLIRPL